MFYFLLYIKFEIYHVSFLFIPLMFGHVYIIESKKYIILFCLSLDGNLLLMITNLYLVFFVYFIHILSFYVYI